MEPESPEASAPSQPSEDIVARAGTYYRWTRYLISIGLLMGYGSFFIRDGFFVWPRELQQARKLEAEGKHADVKPHSDTDIRFQQIIGLVVPPLGLALLLWTLYNSRGEYRLAGHTLHVPGHPPVPLESIVKIDKTVWDKKGIAYIEYLPPGTEDDDPTEAGPTPKKLKLDDFVYNQAQTDAIVERIELIIAPPADENQDEGQVDEPAADSEGTSPG